MTKLAVLTAISDGGERRHDQPQRQRPAQHFERKQGAAERHAVDGGHARAGADRDHEAALFVRKLLQVGGQVAEDGAELLGRAFAAERNAHADDDDRQQRAAERSERRQAAGLEPDRRGNLDAVAAGQPRQQPLAQASEEPGAEQQRNMARRTGLPRRLEQRGRVGRAPGELLHGFEQKCQSGRAKTGA